MTEASKPRIIRWQIVILAHRAAQRQARDPAQLKTIKQQLTKRLYERGPEVERGRATSEATATVNVSG